MLCARRVDSSLTEGRILFNCNQLPLHAIFHYHPSICLKWLKYHGRTIKLHLAIHTKKRGLGCWWGSNITLFTIFAIITCMHFAWHQQFRHTRLKHHCTNVKAIIGLNRHLYATVQMLVCPLSFLIHHSLSQLNSISKKSSVTKAIMLLSPLNRLCDTDSR